MKSKKLLIGVAVLVAGVGLGALLLQGQTQSLQGATRNVVNTSRVKQMQIKQVKPVAPQKTPTTVSSVELSLPDLTIDISNITYDFSAVTAGTGSQYIKVNFNVNNGGTGDVTGIFDNTITGKFYSPNGSLLNTALGILSLTQLGAGETKTGYVNLYPPTSWANEVVNGTGASFMVEGFADAYGSIVESNETNNKDSQFYTLP